MVFHFFLPVTSPIQALACPRTPFAEFAPLHQFRFCSEFFQLFLRNSWPLAYRTSTPSSELGDEDSTGNPFQLFEIGYPVQLLFTTLPQVESSVVDDCLRDMVKMLDSKCDVLSSEAVVALRTLLQQSSEDGGADDDSNAPSNGGLTPFSKKLARSRSTDSGGFSRNFWVQVVTQLIRSLDDVSSAVARASVVWIIGEYQAEVPLLVPDAVRKLAKSFKTEPIEVKQQILSLAFKVWSSRLLGSVVSKPLEDSGVADSVPGEGANSEFHRGVVKRLELMLEYICKVAVKDEDWDVRDMGRAFLHFKNLARSRAGAAGAAPAVVAPAGEGGEDETVPVGDHVPSSPAHGDGRLNFGRVLAHAYARSEGSEEASRLVASLSAITKQRRRDQQNKRSTPSKGGEDISAAWETTPKGTSLVPSWALQPGGSGEGQVQI